LFTLQKAQSLVIDLDLTQPDLTDLVQMTPNYWHMTRQKQKQLREMSHRRTTAHFNILAFSRVK
jgi:hypothetical protein